MKKEELKRELRFLEKCRTYGLNPNKMEVFDDIIIFSERPDLFVLMDQNYNVFGIERDERITSSLDKSFLASTRDFIYQNKANLSCMQPFDYPFEDYSFKDMLNIADRVNVSLKPEELPDLEINGVWYQNNGSDYINLLLYIKYLGEEIKKYFITLYQMSMLGFKMPDITTYLHSLISKINVLLQSYQANDINASAKDILREIGQERKSNQEYLTLLEGIVSTMTDNFNEEERERLKQKANNLIKLLEVPDEVVRERIEISPNYALKQFENLESWLNSNPDKTMLFTREPRN